MSKDTHLAALIISFFFPSLSHHFLPSLSDVCPFEEFLMCVVLDFRCDINSIIDHAP